MSMIPNRFLREGRSLPSELEEARLQITEIARSYGLDFFDTVFELCTYEEINMLAAFGGFPVRYPHWRFGMEYIEMQKGYEYGLSKIYEMVINTDPSYAYLMDCNLMVDQKLVMAHVYGHVDFFKNNLWFSHTNRKMLDTMANHATKVRQIIDRHGTSEVEAFVDICLSLDNLIDPHLPHIQRTRSVSEAELEAAEQNKGISKIPAKPYMDRHINPPEFIAEQQQKKQEDFERMRSFPEEPTRDILGFLLNYAPLARWQQDILRIIRDEAYYFAPQGQTKIMNEGWATFWHTKLMTTEILDDSEVIDYCDHHSGTVAMRPGQLNPYKMGVELFRYIEQRWNKGQFGKEWLDCEEPRVRREWDTGAGLGREKIFEVRKTHNDVTFVDSFLTADFCRDQGFFTTKYDNRAKQWVIDSREFGAIKKQLLEMLATKGTPRVSIIDANAFNRGELMLHHEHEGPDIQIEWASLVMGNLAKVWSRPVHLVTTLDGKGIQLTHDGTSVKKTSPDSDAMKEKEETE